MRRPKTDHDLRLRMALRNFGPTAEAQERAHVGEIVMDSYLETFNVNELQGPVRHMQPDRSLVLEWKGKGYARMHIPAQEGFIGYRVENDKGETILEGKVPTLLEEAIKRQYQV